MLHAQALIFISTPHLRVSPVPNVPKIHPSVPSSATLHCSTVTAAVRSCVVRFDRPSSRHYIFHTFQYTYSNTVKMAQQPVNHEKYIDSAVRAVTNKRPVPEIDFTLHTMEDGSQVSTLDRVCKGE